MSVQTSAEKPGTSATLESEVGTENRADVEASLETPASDQDTHIAGNKTGTQESAQAPAATEMSEEAGGQPVGNPASDSPQHRKSLSLTDVAENPSQPMQVSVSSNTNTDASLRSNSAVSTGGDEQGPVVTPPRRRPIDRLAKSKQKKQPTPASSTKSNKTKKRVDSADVARFDVNNSNGVDKSVIDKYASEEVDGEGSSAETSQRNKLRPRRIKGGGKKAEHAEEEEEAASDSGSTKKSKVGGADSDMDSEADEDAVNALSGLSGADVWSTLEKQTEARKQNLERNLVTRTVTVQQPKELPHNKMLTLFRCMWTLLLERGWTFRIFTSKKHVLFVAPGKANKRKDLVFKRDIFDIKCLIEHVRVVYPEIFESAYSQAEDLPGFRGEEVPPISVSELRPGGMIKERRKRRRKSAASPSPSTKSSKKKNKNNEGDEDDVDDEVNNDNEDDDEDGVLMSGEDEPPKRPRKRSVGSRSSSSSKKRASTLADTRSNTTSDEDYRSGDDEDEDEDVDEDKDKPVGVAKTPSSKSRRESAQADNNEVTKKELTPLSEAEVYDFKLIYPWLQQARGWTARKGNGLIYWYYLKPGVTVKRGRPIGTHGKDYFNSSDEVIAHVKKTDDLREEFLKYAAVMQPQDKIQRFTAAIEHQTPVKAEGEAVGVSSSSQPHSRAARSQRRTQIKQELEATHDDAEEILEEGSEEEKPAVTTQPAKPEKKKPSKQKKTSKQGVADKNIEVLSAQSTTANPDQTEAENRPDSSQTGGGFFLDDEFASLNRDKQHSADAKVVKASSAVAFRDDGGKGGRKSGLAAKSKKNGSGDLTKHGQKSYDSNQTSDSGEYILSDDDALTASPAKRGHMKISGKTKASNSSAKSKKRRQSTSNTTMNDGDDSSDVVEVTDAADASSLSRKLAESHAREAAARSVTLFEQQQQMRPTGSDSPFVSSPATGVTLVASSPFPGCEPKYSAPLSAASERCDSSLFKSFKFVLLPDVPNQVESEIEEMGGSIIPQPTWENGRVPPVKELEACFGQKPIFIAYPTAMHTALWWGLIAGGARILHCEFVHNTYEHQELPRDWTVFELPAGPNVFTKGSYDYPPKTATFPPALLPRNERVLHGWSFYILPCYRKNIMRKIAVLAGATVSDRLDKLPKDGFILCDADGDLDLDMCENDLTLIHRNEQADQLMSFEVVIQSLVGSHALSKKERELPCFQLPAKLLDPNFASRSADSKRRSLAGSDSGISLDDLEEEPMLMAASPSLQSDGTQAYYESPRFLPAGKYMRGGQLQYRCIRSQDIRIPCQSMMFIARVGDPVEFPPRPAKLLKVKMLNGEAWMNVRIYSFKHKSPNGDAWALIPADEFCELKVDNVLGPAISISYQNQNRLALDNSRPLIKRARRQDKEKACFHTLYYAEK